MKTFAPLRGLKRYYAPEMLAELQFRRRGTSTGLALNYLGQAILNPGKEVLVKDHHDSRRADSILMGTIYEMVKELGLEGINFNKADNTILFSLDMTLD